jgi:hypothetical protein
MPELRILKKSRSNILPGDIFTLSLNEGEYYFGKIIKTNVSVFSEDNFLVYIYNYLTKDRTEIPELKLINLLTYPILISNQVFQKGYFEKVGHDDAYLNEIFPAHIFFDPLKENYVTEFGKVTDKPQSEVGIYGIVSQSSLATILEKSLKSIGN